MMNENSTTASDHAFFASCPKGFEGLLADELRSLGTPGVRPLTGQVAFRGSVRDTYRACLWSRLASRVVLVLGGVDARDADALHAGVSSLAWEDQLPQGATIVVDAHGTNAQLRNTQFVAMRTKDAIADRMMVRTGARPVVDVARPDVRVVVRLGRDRASVGIDLSGEALFRRGYERDAHGAGRGARGPRLEGLRCDYAAALLATAGWFRTLRHPHPCLVAAFPGTGTLLVEAAAQALDRAPGLLRRRWGFEGWAGHDAHAWEELVAEARERAEAGRDGLAPEADVVRLVGCDTRRGVEGSARRLLRAAGIDLEPRFVTPGELAGAVAGCVPTLVCDLSWAGGDDMPHEAAALSQLASVAAAVNDAPGEGGAAALARDAVVDEVLGRRPSTTTEVIVGRDGAVLRGYGAARGADAPPTPPTAELPNPHGGAVLRLPVLVAGSDQFARRLAKMARQRAKWARREDVSCYRVYDADLPDYAVTIDLFQRSELAPQRGSRGPWLQVFEYAAPKDVDPALARRRLLDVLSLAPHVLDVSPDNVFLRTRVRARGGSQYAAEAAEGRYGPRRERREGKGSSRIELPRGAHLVDEGGLTFEVNFDLRLDCGIFLDHRDTRALVREMAKQTRGSKRFLNLFAYTGSATCYAADGGCKYTTTVDMSRPSLEWARRNMARNGFVGRQHEYVQADVLSWVNEQRHSRNRWDLVFCDVPTFSNSKGMQGSWDVQRDHVELLIDVSRLLTRDGVALFSCNLRRFKPDVAALAKAGVGVEDITDRTIPEDFSRSPQVHHCYLVRRTTQP